MLTESDVDESIVSEEVLLGSFSIHSPLINSNRLLHSMHLLNVEQFLQLSIRHCLHFVGYNTLGK